MEVFAGLGHLLPRSIAVTKKKEVDKGVCSLIVSVSSKERGKSRVGEGDA